MLDLDELIAALSEAAADDDPALWVRIDDEPGGGLTVGLRTGMDGLLGWRAPATCRAIGAIAGGWATRLDDDGPDNGQPAGRCRVACVMDRGGRIAARTEIGGRVIGEAPTAGRMVDCMFRCFGLATAPPEAPAVQMLTRLWLTEIIDTSRLLGRRLRWADAIRLHPAARTIAAGDRQPDDDFEHILTLAGRCLSWGRMRRQCARGDWVHPSIDASLADWMDDGMFARWALGGLPGTDALLREAITHMCEQDGNRLGTAVSDQIVAAATP